MQINFVYDSDAPSLLKQLNALPEGTRILSIYCNVGRHYAWFQVPETAKVTSGDAGQAPLKPIKKGK